MSAHSAPDQADAALALEELDDEEPEVPDDDEPDELDEDPDELEPESLLVLEELSLLPESLLLLELSVEVLLDPLPRLSVR